MLGGWSISLWDSHLPGGLRNESFAWFTSDGLPRFAKDRFAWSFRVPQKNASEKREWALSDFCCRKKKLLCQVHLIKIDVHTQIPQNQQSLKCFESQTTSGCISIKFHLCTFQKCPQISGFWLTTSNMRSTSLELHGSVAYLGLHLLPQHLSPERREKMTPINPWFFGKASLKSNLPN